MGLRSIGSTAIILVPVGVTGCGSSHSVQQPCTVSYPLTVSPLAATLDHMATGSENTVQFRGVA